MSSTTEIEKKIDQLFRRMGIRGKMKMEKFWQNTIRELGADAESLYHCIQNRSAGIRADPYPLKNKSMALANAVASQYDESRLKAFVLWLINENLTVGDDVLEVGCDNGIFICTLASLFPGSRFTGIDPCAEAVALARQRAKSLGLCNCQFEAISVEEMASRPEERRFSTIIANTVFHEIIADGMIGESNGLLKINCSFFSLSDCDSGPLASELNLSTMSSLASLIGSGGYFISLDRWAVSLQLLRWIRISESHSFALDINRSTVLEVESERTEHLPLTVFIAGRSEKAAACNVLALAAFRKFPVKGCLNITDGNSAELLFTSLARSDMVLREFHYNDGSGTLRVHIGTANGLGYIYQTTSRGFRELSVFPSICLSEHMTKMLARMESLAPFTTAKTTLIDIASATALQIDLEGLAGETHAPAGVLPGTA
jgi:2-polyprenyl-3-methyl-5-hydroxy-6-metoxy-1,4-benzoquinol methylase